MDLTSLLLPDVQDRGAYWSAADDVPETAIWDHLAAEDHVHAAISTDSESGEARKSAAQIDLLERELLDGIVLDAGCGYGRIAKYLLPRRSFSGYVGVDGSENMLEVFASRHAERSREEGATPLLLVRAPIYDVPVGDDTCDNVVFSAVILHNAKSVARQAVAEAHRLLRPGGRVLAVGDDFRNMATLEGLQGGAYLGLLRARGEDGRNGPIRYYLRRELAALFSDFSHVRIRPQSFHVLPKRIIGVPPGMDRNWRRRIWEPSQSLATRFTPRRLQRSLCHHWDVIATK